MVLRPISCARSGALAILLVSAPSFASRPAGPLEDGRAALARGDHKGALTAYRSIGPDDSRWPEKVEDLIRYHLRKGEALEAWRLTQLEVRLGRTSSTIRDYERLAVLKDGACPLGLPKGGDELRSTLIDAAGYRHLQSSFASSRLADPLPNQDSNLAPGLVPFVSDIPQTKLVKGRGCRLARAAFARSSESARTSELKTILHAIELMPQAHEPGRFALLARALWLANASEDDRARIKATAMLPPVEAAPWAQTTDPERRLLFRAYFTGSKLDDLPEASRAIAQKIALSVLREASAPSAAAWLAFVDLDSLAPKDRARLLERVEKSGSFEGRAWVLYQLARARWESNDAREALTVLRRVFVENDESLSDELERAFADLAARIFAEHRFDQRMSGALRASTPARLWATLIEQARLRTAFDGRVDDFRRLGAIATTGSSNASRSAAWAIAGALASRNLSMFSRHVAKDASDRGQGVALVANAMTARLLEMSEVDRRMLALYAVVLARALEAEATARNVRASSGESLADLAHALSAAALEPPGNAARDGERIVRKGAVRVGHVKVGMATPERPAFRIESPTSLAPREFIFVPSDVAGRGWSLSTALE